jgi:hypothetical protein
MSSRSTTTSIRRWMTMRPDASPDSIVHAQQLCDDPDCELHNPLVAYQETVIGEKEYAYFLVGAETMYDLIREGFQAGFTIEQCLAAASGEFHDVHGRFDNTSELKEARNV